MAVEYSLTNHAIKMRIWKIFRALNKTDGFTPSGAIVGFKEWFEGLNIAASERAAIERSATDSLMTLERRLRLVRQQLHSEVFHKQGDEDGEK